MSAIWQTRRTQIVYKARSAINRIIAISDSADTKWEKQCNAGDRIDIASHAESVVIHAAFRMATGGTRSYANRRPCPWTYHLRTRRPRHVCLLSNDRGGLIAERHGLWRKHRSRVGWK